MDEQTLIKKAQNGDKKALTELVKMYEQTIYNFAFKLCRDKEKAEHSMQETFFSMIKSIKQFTFKSKFSTWLYTIVSNHCLMMARSKKKHSALSFDDDTNTINESTFNSWDISPDKVVENNELKVMLDEVIKKLPYNYRIVFLLRDVEGLSTEETAQSLNLSIAAVKSRLHRSRAFLRNELDKELKK